MNTIKALTLSSALELLREKKISAQELAEASYRQIEQLNPKLNAFITVIDPLDALSAQLPDDNAFSSNARHTASPAKVCTARIPVSPPARCSANAWTISKA